MHRNAIIVGVLLFALSWVGLATAQSQSVESIPYVYRIDIKGCTFEPVNRRQTGFRVQGLTGIVTALHGVADCETIHATADGGQEIFTDLEIQQVDIARDIVLLSSPELAALPADGLVASSLSTTEMLTTTLRVVGYPLGLDKQDTDLIESIRAVESLDDVIPDAEEPADFIKRKSPSLDIDVLNLQAQLLPGHSGAPVIAANDQLIAVGNGGLRGGTVGRSWAIPWQDVALQAVGDVKSQLDALAAKDIAALAFSSTYPGQVDSTTTQATYTVQVVDAIRNQPVANAEVLLTHSAGYEIGVTDSKGFHTFHLSTDTGIDYGQSQLQVEAAGYASYSRDLTNVLARVSPEKLGLTALSPTATVLATSTPTIVSSQLCSFAFVVLDSENEEPIRRATISVLVGIRQGSGTTDSNGYYLVKLPCSNEQDVEARVRVTVSDYTAYNRSVFLSNETTEILLEHKPIPTPTQTPPTQPTPTVAPSPTVKRELSYFPVSLTSVANNSTNEGYVGLPVGDTRLNDIPFYIADGQNSVTTQAEALPSNPSMIQLGGLNIKSPRNVYLLVTGGSTRLAFKDHKIGQIRFIFSDNQSYAVDLVAGVNIREWKNYGDHNVTTISGPDAVQVWAGNNKFDSSIATIDMLTVDIPPTYQKNTLVTVEIHDLSEQTVGNLNPAINLIGVTVLGVR